ncbi:MAG: NAD(P)-binding domain-containing protein [Chloroflexota bacterium]
MNIAVLGTGHIGGTLGNKWAKAGHTVRFGARDPQKAELQELLKSIGENASASSIAEAIAFGEVVLFAIPGTVMDATIADHAKALKGKIIIDSANKMNTTPRNSMAIFAALVPAAKVYRAFNAYGWENFETPTFDNITADLFYCGPNGESRAVMDKLIADIGLEPMYLGGAEQAELVDALLALWFTLAIGQKMGRHLALKVLKG